MKDVFFLVILSTLFFCVDLFSEEKNEKQTQIINPFGVCSHLSRWEFDCADAQLKLMREAGISAFRTDFDWGAVEKEKGKFKIA